MKKYLFITSIFLALMLFSTASIAAPGLCITKPPVIGPPNTGPLIDPPSMHGQWFKDIRTGVEQYRPCEFYDNVQGFGGGWRSNLAIEGYVIQVNFDVAQNITDFFVDVTITNDMPATTMWAPGHNQHNELLQTTNPEEQMMEVPMLNVKWTASFADDVIVGNFPMGGPPYMWAQGMMQQLTPVLMPESIVYAKPFSILDPEGYDELAWYCWTPGSSSDPQKDGQYMVPTWDFGNIVQGQSVSRIVHFYLRQPVPPPHPLYNFLQQAYFGHYDILLNRTTSLKVSDYFDILAFDFGIPYPEGEPLTGSDCSVFFDIVVPQPPDFDDVYRDHTTGGIVFLFANMQAGWTYGIESSITPYDPNYNEAAMVWNFEAGGGPVASWTDFNCPPLIGREKYYRIWVNHPCGWRIYCPHTVGAMSIPISVKRNLVSSPFQPYPDGGLSGGGIMGSASLNKIVGPQLTGSGVKTLSDNIERWINAPGFYQRAWYNTAIIPGSWRDWTAGPPLFGIDSDVGYWFNINPIHPPMTVTFCGRVSKVNRMVPINLSRNLVGSCFPVMCPLSQSNLVGSGFKGAAIKTLSDSVEFWNNPASVYERFWFNTAIAPGVWTPYNLGQPMRNIMPGDGIWVNVIPMAGHAPFTWKYLVPPRPAWAP